MGGPRWCCARFVGEGFRRGSRLGRPRRRDGGSRGGGLRCSCSRIVGRRHASCIASQRSWVRARGLRSSPLSRRICLHHAYGFVGRRPFSARRCVRSVGAARAAVPYVQDTPDVSVVGRDLVGELLGRRPRDSSWPGCRPPRDCVEPASRAVARCGSLWALPTRFGAVVLC